MASSPNEAKDLIADLNFERLQQKYAELLKLHQDSEKQSASLADQLTSAHAQFQESDAIRQELEALKREIASTRAEASNKERKNAELISSTNNELLETKSIQILHP
ncbi:hypothetical protein CLU79DRAFT_729665 [Phycomyces nitens]|nr:hypothetical protein CLU79DRAFT_729665 [Phycomyces nitens]